MAALAACGDDQTTPVDADTGTEGTSTGTTPGTDEGMPTGDESTTGSGASETAGSTDVDSTDGTEDGDTTDGTTGSATDDGSSSGDTGSTGETGTTGGVFVCDPIDLGSATSIEYLGTTDGSGNDLVASCADFDGPELELVWTAPTTDTYQIDTLGSAFDTVLQVVRDDCEGEWLACNDDFSGLQSAMLVDLQVGETIVILVDGYGGAAGDFALHIDVAMPGSCCEVGFFPGCADNTCEAAVCAFDASCCTSVWDETCAEVWAPVVCASCAPPGSCCHPQTEAGCTDQECQDDVCAVDPSCCDTQWTDSCATLAASTCTACMPAECCSAHEGPGCASSSCQATVCNEWDSWCCMVEWDAWCAQLANDNCAICQEPGPCCAANPAPGCDQPAVESCVCDAQPECCSGEWTGSCVAAVTSLGCGTCDPPDLSCVDFDLGSALGEVHTGTNVGAGNDTTISCTAAGGEEYVFSWVAPSSGTFVFDTVGSDYDTALSVRFPDCAGNELGCVGILGDFNSSLTLDLVDGQPVVITLDGFGAAVGNYVLNINPPPGFGFCCAANGSPGCSSAPCEAAVCAADPSCCTLDWSDSCAATAATECAVCQNLGDCCSAHMEPGCEDLECTETVCAFDPWCCDDQWYDSCVDQAEMLCPGLCS